MHAVTDLWSNCDGGGSLSEKTFTDIFQNWWLVGDKATMCHHAIEKVFQLAAATFSKKAGPDSFTGNLEKLISLTNKLGGSDVGLDCCAALQKSTNNSPSNTQDSPRGSRDRCFLREGVNNP